MSDRVVLRYFPVCGRAQPLRHVLADAGVPFDDVRVPLAAWPAHQDDPAFGGPYGALPTLTWGAATVAETLPIASFLARRLGHRDGLDDAAVARRDAVCSHAYLEVMLRVADLLYAEFLFPGAEPLRALPNLLGWMLGKLARLDAQLAGDAFFGGAAPDVADFVAAEAVETLRYVIGSARDPGLRQRASRGSRRTRIARCQAGRRRGVGEPSVHLHRAPRRACDRRAPPRSRPLGARPLICATVTLQGRRPPSSRQPQPEERADRRPRRVQQEALGLERRERLLVDLGDEERAAPAAELVHRGGEEAQHRRHLRRVGAAPALDGRVVAVDHDAPGGVAEPVARGAQQREPRRVGDAHVAHRGDVDGDGVRAGVEAARRLRAGAAHGPDQAVGRVS